LNPVRAACPSPEHNRTVGGATRSKHLDGTAFGIAMANHDPVAFEAAARAFVPDLDMILAGQQRGRQELVRRGNLFRLPQCALSCRRRGPYVFHKRLARRRLLPWWRGGRDGLSFESLRTGSQSAPNGGPKRRPMTPSESETSPLAFFLRP